ncbi:MAG: hypothetical protein HPY69_18120 [Armatimonadetes bacterium]|nr:hypothetical protein [Armatimonadota bacterium]
MRHLRFLPLLLLTVPCLAGTVTGHVFLDTNGDGQWQAADQPCAGALVTDGLTVVATAADGAYVLDSPDGYQVISVENPPQTWPTHGFWRGVTVGPATADFPLRAQEQSLPFYFVQGTDLHTRPDVDAQMAHYVTAINSLPVPLAFVVHTGDLVVDTCARDVPAARALFDTYIRQVAALKAPLFNVPGNHEHVSWRLDSFDPEAPGVGKSMYRELLGPMVYSFNYAGVHFVALDGTDLVNGKLAYSMPASCVEWLRRYVAHIPVTDRMVILIHEPLHALPQRAAVEEVLADRTVMLTLSGHWHSLARAPVAGGVEIVAGQTSYAWHGNPGGFDAMAYNVVRITADGFESAMGDWAERYPVTVAEPALRALLDKPLTVRAHFLDLGSEVRSASIALGSMPAVPAALGADGLYRTATATLDPAQLPDGFHDLTITLVGTGEPFVERQPRLVMSGNEEAFNAVGPAVLSLRLQKVNAANQILLNGQPLATMPANAANNQVLQMTVPPERLRRLNVIEVESAELVDGVGYDDFSVDQVSLTYGGKVYRDPRFVGGGSASVTNITRASRGVCYVDLGYQSR